MKKTWIKSLVVVALIALVGAYFAVQWHSCDKDDGFYRPTAFGFECLYP